MGYIGTICFGYEGKTHIEIPLIQDIHVEVFDMLKKIVTNRFKKFPYDISELVHLLEKNYRGVKPGDFKLTLKHILERDTHFKPVFNETTNDQIWKLRVIVPQTNGKEVPVTLCIYHQLNIPLFSFR